MFSIKTNCQISDDYFAYSAYKIQMMKRKKTKRNIDDSEMEKKICISVPLQFNLHGSVNLGICAIFNFSSGGAKFEKTGMLDVGLRK